MFIKELIKSLLEIEGTYSDHKYDSGGKTKFGITEKVAIDHDYYGDMKDLPYEKAEEIYISDYWVEPNFDSVAELGAKDVAAKLFEMGVNIGTGRASVYLQKVLNAFNMNQRFYRDLVIDGDVGSVTLEALRKYILRREENVIVTALGCLQGEYYIFISQKYPKNEAFVYGWMKNRVSLCGHG